MTFWYLFIPGNSPQLSQAELESVLSSKKIKYQLQPFDKVFLVDTEEEIDSLTLIKVLGGTVKITHVFRVVSDLGTISDIAVDFLKSRGVKKIVFGLSSVQNGNSRIDPLTLSKKIKKRLKEKNFSCRFVFPRDNNALSSVQVTKEKVIEIVIFEKRDKWYLAHTETVQDFEDWNKRDYQRPFSDPQSGMLPPKVARMMVNIGRSAFVRLRRTSADKWKIEDGSLNEIRLLDPFCGSGTILQEGLAMGFSVLGFDNNKKTVENAQKNLAWFCDEYQVPCSKYQMSCFTAEHISQKLALASVDVIVTEPYLGPRFITFFNIKNIIMGLEKLYIGCLREWHKVLKNDGIIVIALPSFVISNKEYFVKKTIDKISDLGYSIETGPLPYYREKAVVRRNIYVLKKL